MHTTIDWEKVREAVDADECEFQMVMTGVDLDELLDSAVDFARQQNSPEIPANAIVPELMTMEELQFIVRETMEYEKESKLMVRLIDDFGSVANPFLVVACEDIAMGVSLALRCAVEDAGMVTESTHHTWI